MTEFVLKTILRVISILFYIGLLKFSLDVITTNDEIWVQIIFLIIMLLGVPLIFLLTNVVVNLIKFGNKGKKK